jgi:hypothetical protein
MAPSVYSRPLFAAGYGAKNKRRQKTSPILHGLQLAYPLLHMADDPTATDLMVVQSRREYWQAQYEAALAADDRDAATNALKRVRLYEWLIESLEESQK